MKRKSVRRLALLLTVALMTVGVSSAQQSLVNTVITVPDMDCEHCAQQVEQAVAKVPGIAKIEYSVDKRKLTIYPQPRVILSPRMLWEAVERSEKLPTRLEGPSGTFTKKPKS